MQKGCKAHTKAWELPGPGKPATPPPQGGQHWGAITLERVGKGLNYSFYSQYYKNDKVFFTFQIKAYKSICTTSLVAVH